MRVAVTGGLGFIGQAVVKGLLDANHGVVIFDFWKSIISRYENNRYPILEPTYENMTRARVYEPYELHEMVGDFDAIVHLGAVVDTTDMGEDGGLWDLNVEYTRRIVAECDTKKVKIIFASSAARYGSGGFMPAPNNPYGLSKMLGEQAIYDANARAVIMRLFNVFGIYEHHKGAMASVPFKLAQAYKSGGVFDMFAPDAQRDFVPVDDVVSNILSELQDFARIGPRLKTIDVGTGTATSFADLDNFIMQATNHPTSRVRFVEMPKELVGRYQGYTCAGHKDSPRAMTFLGTRNGIEMYYGR